MKIYGKSLRANIKAMEIFGEARHSVVQQLGIQNINDDDVFSPELRTKVFDAIAERYGEPALIATGFSNADQWWGVVQDIVKDQLAIKDNISKEKLYQNQNVTPFDGYPGVPLNRMCDILMMGWDYAIKNLIITDDKSYEAHAERIGDFESRLYLKIVGIYARHFVFTTAVLEYQLIQLFGKNWDFNLKLQSDDTKDDVHGCRFVYVVKFKKREGELDVDITLKDKKNKINEGLLQNVLQHSEAQRAKLEGLSSQLGKYVPPQIHEALFTGNYNTEIATQRKKLTIFFSDIVNFTSTSEGLQPEDLTKYLNEYFSEMTTIALDCGATIDKYIGDAMMVFFGDPQSRGERDDARACVEMALKMQQRMRELQNKWSNEGFSDPFQVRMGMNTGYCNVGNFGSDQRLTYTIIGGEVNVAQRLEANADPNGALMSYETYAHAQDIIQVEQRETIKMKGISREIKVFSIVGQKVLDKSILNKEKGKVTDSVKSGEAKKALAKIELDVQELKKSVSEIQRYLRTMASDKE